MYKIGSMEIASQGWELGMTNREKIQKTYSINIIKGRKNGKDLDLMLG